MTDSADSIEAARLIERLDGGSSAARFFGVTKGAVSQWLVNGIPKDKIRILKAERPEFFVKDKGSRKRSPTKSTPLTNTE